MIARRVKKNIKVFENRHQLGEKAGGDVENAIIDLLTRQTDVRIIFAAAPSQTELLEYLSRSDKVDWSKVIAFNMDEYLGLHENTKASFATFLNEKLFNKVSPKKINLINTENPPAFEIERFGDLITEKRIDIVCLGIGENGHIAFNDPPVADFNDKATIKIVELDDSCRLQQVNEGCFDNMADVPKKALTLTIPIIMGAKKLFCVVPGKNKKQAVLNALTSDIDESCPATILRTHLNCDFYFDDDSFQLVNYLTD